MSHLAALFTTTPELTPRPRDDSSGLGLLGDSVDSLVCGESGDYVETVLSII
jgi:hypothetical protein